jgi:hypothetical protein
MPATAAGDEPWHLGRRRRPQTAIYAGAIAVVTTALWMTACDRRYREGHGVRVGMATAAAERQLHRRLRVGCLSDIHLYGPRATVAVEFGGRAMVIHHDGTVSGGHVAVLVLHGNRHDPGVFECM